MALHRFYTVESNEFDEETFQGVVGSGGTGENASLDANFIDSMVC